MPKLARPDPPLADAEVVLRPFTVADVTAVTAACQDPEIHRWTASLPWPYEERHARHWIATHEVRWAGGEGADLAVTATGDGRLLGSLGFVAFDWDGRVSSVGYWVAAAERGRGVATRALRLGTDWALTTLGLGTVELVTMFGNVASERVAEKAEFSMVGEIPDYVHQAAPGRLYRVKHWQRRAPEAR